MKWNTLGTRLLRTRLVVVVGLPLTWLWSSLRLHKWLSSWQAAEGLLVVATHQLRHIPISISSIKAQIVKNCCMLLSVKLIRAGIIRVSLTICNYNSVEIEANAFCRTRWESSALLTNCQSEREKGRWRWYRIRFQLTQWLSRTSPALCLPISLLPLEYLFSSALNLTSVSALNSFRWALLSN